MIARALNLNLNNRPNPGFSDVGTNHTAYKAIAALVDEGYFYKTPKFYPDHALIRQEMARILVTAYSLKGVEQSHFTDVPTWDVIYENIDALAHNNITVGYPDGSFKPHGAVTRVQFSVFLSRSMDDKFKVPTIPEKSEPVLMKDITFGMTYQQVKNRETRQIVFDSYGSGSLFLVYDVKQYDRNAELVYGFNAYSTLNNTWYDFNPSKIYYTGSELYQKYSAIKTATIGEFGEADVSNEDTYANYKSLWTMNGYNILLNVRNVGGESKITLSYHPQQYQGASVEDKENKLNKLMEEMDKLR